MNSLEAVPARTGGNSGLVCLAMLARLHGKTADPTQLKHDLALADEPGFNELLLACKRIGLRGRVAKLDLKRASQGKLPLPCIVQCARGFKILAAINAEGSPKVLLHDPATGRPEGITLDQFLASAPDASILLVTSRSTLAAELVRIDFTWFVPAIVKYRKLLSEALIASLYLQVFALMTPLFFQVVMDKVLVHKGYSTLVVIAIGLLGVVLFESLLSALRNYVFAHTTSRIEDARTHRAVSSMKKHFDLRGPGSCVGGSVRALREAHHAWRTAKSMARFL